MSENRKNHFDSLIGSKREEVTDDLSGIWQLPESILDDVYGGADFTQAGPGGYSSFAQNFACFAQNIGNFSQWV